MRPLWRKNGPLLSSIGDGEGGGEPITTLLLPRATGGAQLQLEENCSDTIFVTMSLRKNCVLLI